MCANARQGFSCIKHSRGFAGKGAVTAAPLMNEPKRSGQQAQPQVGGPTGQQIARAPDAAASGAEWRDTLWPAQEPEPPVQPLTREEAQALIARHPQVTAWQVIAGQALVGVLVALVWGALSGSQAATMSSLYGAAVAVVPNVLMARGLFGRHAGRSVGGLLAWELVKIGGAGAMLALAPTIVQPLNWAAMLVTMVLCMKVIGVALLWRGRKKSS